ncbi:hypothetical protein LB507_005044 [Fusarium sp. FIESC RH6]|nr:hypothetical protein LB507_005044 [Fusarium sp. FIESC RH6]
MPQGKSPNFLGVMSSDASKSRRERNREAQQQFRKRRQAAEAARMQRLKHLEGIIEKMSTVIIGFTDKMLQEDVLKRYPALAADAQDVIAQVLALANEAGDPEEGSTAEQADGTSPDTKEQDSGFLGQPFSSSPLPSDMMHLDSENTMFMTHSSPEYSHVMGASSVSYTHMHDPMLSQASYLSSSIPQSLDQMSWNTSNLVSPTSFTYQPSQAYLNVGSLPLYKSCSLPLALQNNPEYSPQYYDGTSATR